MFFKEELEWSLVGNLYKGHKVQLWGELQVDSGDLPHLHMRMLWPVTCPVAPEAA